MIQDTAAFKLLSLAALSGEFPAAALGRLLGDGRYKEKVITELKAKKLLKVYSRDGVRAYRLMLGGKKLLLQENPARFAPILTTPIQTRQDLPHRIRQHQMCEVLLYMQKSGISIFPDEKTALSGQTPLPDETQTGIRLPAYYSSLEIKALGPDSTKIKNARFCGVLLTRQRIYLVYNAGDSLMRWEQKSEIKTRALVAYLLCRERLPERYARAEVQGILMGTEMETARRLLCAGEPKSFRVFRLDQTFEHFHFVPGNPQGELLLRLLCIEERTLELREVLSDGLRPANPRAPIENDGFEEDGTPVLFSFDGDLQRLSNFVSMLQLRESKGVIVCFDFQAQVFGAYCGESVRLQTIDLEKYKRRFLPPEEAIL